MPTNLDDLRRLQKNARNKLYRLRKKGISNAQIGAMASPVQSWDHVQSMNARQKAQYAQQLRDFNSRDNRIELQGSGEEYLMQRGSRVALPAPAVWSFRLLEAESNVKRKELGDSIKNTINRSFEEVPTHLLEQFETFDREPPDMVRRTDMSTKAASIAPVEPRTEAFNSQKNLDRSTYQLADDLSKQYYGVNDKRSLNYMYYTANRMLADGYITDEEYRNMLSLTPNQINWLYYRTDFDSMASLFLYPEEEDEGYISVNDQTKQVAANTIEQMVNVARALLSYA